MTIWNLGSINADHVYALPHIPRAGETLAATAFSRGLGGKGANMSVACARAGADVRHIGAVGPDGGWAIERLASYGVVTGAIATLDATTGHAIIAVGTDAENMIIILPGANRVLPASHVEAALKDAASGDWFLTQNETNLQVETAASARRQGLRVAYAAAPFDAAAARAMLPYADLLMLNAVEADQLRAATGQGPGALGLAHVIVTLGAEGCLWFHDGREDRFPAPRVTAVDTTGAGDTFAGYVLAGLDDGAPMADAIALAIRAAALKVTRAGAADAIPTKAEAEAFHG